jgi:glycerophosphoryl diester phosphodiesterase
MKRLLLIAALMLSACGNSSEAILDPNRRGDPSAAEPLAPANLPAFFDCLRERGQTVVAAHRGGPAPGFAENSIEAFANTIRQAPALLEIDIAQTRDGVLVLMHDDEVDRTTTGAGRVRDLTLADLQALNLVDEDGRALDAHAPTFADVLIWANGRAILELDVKRGVSYEDVVDAVRAAGAEDRVIFITYSDDAAARVHRLAPELMLSITIDEASDLDALARRGVDLTRVLAWTGTEEPDSALNVALAERGVEAMFGTLGGRNSWDERFARTGDQYADFAETGLALIATDRPVEASQHLNIHDGVDGLGSMQCAVAP